MCVVHEPIEELDVAARACIFDLVDPLLLDSRLLFFHPRETTDNVKNALLSPGFRRFFSCVFCMRSSVLASVQLVYFVCKL